jgi:hypothetical protein
MVDVIALLRERDPAAGTPPVADAAGIRARATQSPRDSSALVRRRSSGKRPRLVVIVAVAMLALGGTAIADRLLSANEVFSSPDAVGQGSLSDPVHPVADTERVVQTLSVPGIGRVQLWAARGSTSTGACLGLRFPDGSWGAGKGTQGVGGNGPSCFTERDDPMFKDTLIPTGIDWFESQIDEPFTRIVYGIIDSDVPATATRVVDKVTGVSTPVIDGRYFAYIDPRGDRLKDDRRHVAYDAAGKIVTGERPGGGPNRTALGSG